MYLNTAQLWIPLVSNRRDQLGSSGLHLLETLCIYLLDRVPELGIMLKQKSYKRLVKGKYRPLVPVV